MAKVDSATERAGAFAMALEQIGALIIRATIGLLFVSAPMCAARILPRGRAPSPIGRRPADAARRLVGAARYLPPARGAHATLFLIAAAMIHFRKARQAAALKDAMLAGPAGKSGGARASITALGESAVLGNFTSAVKNLTLMALTLYVALAGASRCWLRPRRPVAGFAHPALRTPRARLLWRRGSPAHGRPPCPSIRRDDRSWR